jgi:hypothetical protein
VAGRRRDRHVAAAVARPRERRAVCVPAIQSFELDDATLSIALSIENAGRARLPFGLGLHPFVVRDDTTELAAAAGGLCCRAPISCRCGT